CITLRSLPLPRDRLIGDAFGDSGALQYVLARPTSSQYSRSVILRVGVGRIMVQLARFAVCCHSRVSLLMLVGTKRSPHSFSRFLLFLRSVYLLRRLAAVEIPPNVGDFRLVDRKALEVFRRMRERDPFVRGMFGWMGFRQAAVTHDRPGRSSGRRSILFGKMVALALHGVLGFSDIPLRLALWVGVHH